MDSFAVEAGLTFLWGQGSVWVIVVAPSPTIFVINWYPKMAVLGVVSAGWRDGSAKGGGGGLHDSCGPRCSHVSDVVRTMRVVQKHHRILVWKVTFRSKIKFGRDFSDSRPSSPSTARASPLF